VILPTAGRRHYFDNSGMTLIEGIVGLAMAIVVIGMIVETYIVTIRLTQTGFHRAEQLEEAQLVLEYLTRDLHSAVAVAPGEGGFKLELPAKEGESLDKVQFARTVTIFSQEKAYPALIQYQLSSSGRFIRKLKYTGEIPEDVPSFARETERPVGLGLEDTLYFWEIECLPAVSGESASGWTRKYEETQPLPAMVKIRIKLVNKHDPKAQLDMTRIVRTGGL
jgi:hypothetical protein